MLEHHLDARFTQQSLEYLHIPLADAQGLAAVLEQLAPADKDCLQTRGERGRRVQHPQQRGQRELLAIETAFKTPEHEFKGYFLYLPETGNLEKLFGVLGI